MTPEEIGKILGEAAARPLPEEARAATLKAQSAIVDNLRPVRRLPASFILTLLFFGAFVAVAAASSFLLGIDGFHALNGLERAVIYPTLILLALLAAVAGSRQMRPAGGSWLSTGSLLLTLACFPAVVLAIFRGYDTVNFVVQGVPCLRAGLLVALPAAFLITWILRRGFVLDWSAAGLAGGALAGLTGLEMLEAHCPNLKAIHIMVWHLGVVVVSVALGLAIGQILDFTRKRFRGQSL